MLDGPNAGQGEIRTALETIRQGGLFGYRFHYPAMRVGSHEIYWHRPLVACLSSQTGRPAVLPDDPPGYVTAYEVGRPDLDHPIELGPRLLQRSRNLTAIELFQQMKHQHKTITRALNLGAAHKLLGDRKLPRSFARRIVMLPGSKTLDGLLDSLREAAGNPERGQWLAGQLQEMVEAATVDGASKLRILVSVIIPNIRSGILVLVSLLLISTLKVFDIVWIVTRTGPGIATDVLATNMIVTAYDQRLGTLDGATVAARIPNAAQGYSQPAAGIIGFDSNRDRASGDLDYFGLFKTDGTYEYRYYAYFYDDASGGRFEILSSPEPRRTKFCPEC